MGDLPPQRGTQIGSVDRALRFAFAMFVLVISRFNLRLALTIHALNAVFNDMLGGRALPALTRLVIAAQPLLIAVGAVIPLAAILMIFKGSLSRALYVIGTLILVVFVQLLVTSQAMMAPLIEVIKGMSQPG